MAFPHAVHSVISEAEEAAWPVEGQGVNECGCTSAANALNLLCGERRFAKDAFIREAGLLFQRELGGTPSPLAAWLIRRHGFGTHYGNLSHTNYEQVLCDLIDRKVPVVVELGAFKLAGKAFYGEHAIVLVGYKNVALPGAPPLPEEFYFVDAQWPELGKLSLKANNRDGDGDGVIEVYPGNRTLNRDEFRTKYPLRIYFPVFPTQRAHDEWYTANMTAMPRLPVLGWLSARWLSGSYDLWHGERSGQ
jgi:hypothetical protein